MRDRSVTQLAKMSFDEILDITAGVYFYFYSIICSGSFLNHAVQQVNLSTFHQALINTAVHQTPLTFDIKIETTHGHSSSFRTRSHECR